MDPRARESYLESQILTASPQKLRLMLIEAALASSRQAVEQLEQDQAGAAVEALLRCRRIVTELLSSIQPSESDLVRRVTAVYLFIYKTLVEAQLRRDVQLIRDAIRVLEIERETWRQVCEKMPQAPASPYESSEITSADAQRLLAAQSDAADSSPPSSGGLLLDA